ncbi:MAG: ribonuclease P protein component [Candidatus Yanofskybacteria bacterium]|nr:ribonuclease P protein component [Candidatus Yanofskybacteria bacterium]
MALPAKHRLGGEGAFKEILKTGKTLRGSFLLIKFVPNKHAPAKVGIIVSNKVLDSAVARNRLRRVLSEQFQAILPKLEGYDMVVRVTNSGTEQELTREFTRLLGSLS